MPSAEPVVNEFPDWALESGWQGIDGDYCGNCHGSWPCNCDDPAWICGICGGDQYECRCSERSGTGDLPDWAT